MMIKSSQLATLVVIVQLMFLTFAVGVPMVEEVNKDASKNGPNYPMALNYLGMVDGIAFFAEVNVTQNWTMADSYCHTSSLKLASIESKEQADFLITALSIFGNGNHYWTSARESRNISMMAWGNTGNQPNATFLPVWDFSHVSAYAYCAALVYTNSSIVMHTHPCAETTNMFTLCQS